MRTASLVAWFGQIIDREQMSVVAGRLGVELAERVAQGRLTVADLWLVADVLGRNVLDLLPETVDLMNGSGDDLLRRDVECTA